MKRTLLHIVLILLVTLLVSCVRTLCDDCGDKIMFQTIKVKIVNSQGQNLLFGPAAVYNADSIKILEQKNNPVTNELALRLDWDSTLLLRLVNPFDKNYIYYNRQTPVDSIQFKFTNTIITCCGRKEPYSRMDSVIFNNMPAQPVDRVCIFVK